MKKLLFLYLILIHYQIVIAQQTKKAILNVDTMNCSNEDTTFNKIVELNNKTCIWKTEPGFNKIYNKDGTINREGFITNRFSIRTFLMVGRFKPKRKTGQWIYYQNNKVRQIIIYNGKGLSVEQVKFNEHGQIEEKVFRTGKSIYAEYYLPSGKLIENEVWEHLEQQKEIK